MPRLPCTHPPNDNEDCPCIAEAEAERDYPIDDFAPRRWEP